MFELPLLNTVKINTINNLFINIAVWVWISLYIFIIHNNFHECSLSSPCSYHVSRIRWNIHTKKPITNRYYSTSVATDNSDNEFFKWFSGFTDAEGSFLIVALPKGFNFKLSIGLHLEDVNALNYIKDKLGFGKVYSFENTSYFNVTKKEDIIKLINIFETYTLNSTKKLDFRDFKKAYYLYNNRDLLTEELIIQILEIKNNMNSSRKDTQVTQEFKRHACMHKSWLIGFMEGDGSFSLSRNTMEPTFAIRLTESQLPLLIEIKEYLKNSLDIDLYSKKKLESSPIISIGKGKAVNNSKPLTLLTIRNIHFLNNCFIPFFNENEFITKKGLDFKEFKIICNAIYIGAHRSERIKSLLIKLSFCMNNYRLSYTGEKIHISTPEVNEIINAKAMIQHLSDGRELDINTKKIIHRRSSSSIYEISKHSTILNCKEIILKQNLADSAKELGVGFNTLKKLLDSQPTGYSIEYKGNTIRRIGVFSEKKKDNVNKKKVTTELI